MPEEGVTDRLHDTNGTEPAYRTVAAQQWLRQIDACIAVLDHQAEILSVLLEDDRNFGGSEMETLRALDIVTWQLLRPLRDELAAVA